MSSNKFWHGEPAGEAQNTSSNGNLLHELIALADHSDMVMTARLLLAELGLGQDRTPVHEDNSAAIQILGDRRYDGRTKHVDYRIKSVRERVLSGAINVTYISTKLQRRTCSRRDFLVWITSA
ncbi:hypothetical protein RI054_41g148720 [Pseudoscourfieldia marina]